ncbi:hypothetical protein FA15DRAFT_670676 [Coprinopsis marcescibilis]|uniref:PUB domain-containing protein n=1 Tax=Coprinopsis marcescibilis TaxID=230819 RepID=A0A5C3KRN2_COPMA|nr:hypothetical protein FA15DRAFT_670676 [Coprinopsis marcescibilis]
MSLSQHLHLRVDQLNFIAAQTLLTIAENLIREPDNTKFQRFKPTNSVIKRELVDRKGTLEYAIELGFRPQVENFQPYYAFHQRHMEDLKIGTQILKDFLHLYQEKDERAMLAKQNEKAIKDAAHEKVKLAFMDDRKTRLRRDEIEKQAREAREAMRQSEGPAEIASTVRPSSPSRSSSVGSPALGEGRVLGETAPPPYEG